MTRSVLRIADQEADRFPDRCVLSGDVTGRAAQVRAARWDGPRWLLGLPGFAVGIGMLPGRSSRLVALPVAEWVWTKWSRRNTVALACIGFATVLIAAGGWTQSGGLLAIGLVVLLAASAYRARAVHNYWTTCRISSAEDTIIVEPTHPEFDRQARELFTRSLG